MLRFRSDQGKPNGGTEGFCEAHLVIGCCPRSLVTHLFGIQQDHPRVPDRGAEDREEGGPAREEPYPRTCTCMWGWAG